MSYDRNLTHQFNETDHEYDYYEPFEYRLRNQSVIYFVSLVSFPVASLIGICSNILGIVTIIRRRSWLRHEGYVYLTAIFSANIGILFFDSSTVWLTNMHWRYYPTNTSEFMCRVWHFLMTIFLSLGWLTVALLFDVYLREHLIHRRRFGCPHFAAKYCTIFAAKIIVGVIFGVLFLSGIPYLAMFSLFEGLYCTHVSGLWIYMLAQFILMWGVPFVFFLPVILLLALCTSREGNDSGFSQIQERSLADNQFRTLAVILSSMTFFSQFVVNIQRRFLYVDFLEYIETVINLVHCLSLGFQPFLCIIIMKEFREGFCSVFRGVRCCRRCVPLDEGNDNEVLHMETVNDDPLITAEI